MGGIRTTFYDFPYPYSLSITRCVRLDNSLEVLLVRHLQLLRSKRLIHLYGVIMSKFWSTVLGLFGLVSLLIFQNCGGKAASSADYNGTEHALNGTTSNSIQVSGTVTKPNLDGCNYLICSIDNTDGKTKCFIPQNMDPALLNEGNVVTVDGIIRNDILTTCMAGSVLQVSDAHLDSGSMKPTGL
jgi:hypothetical protein